MFIIATHVNMPGNHAPVWLINFEFSIILLIPTVDKSCAPRPTRIKSSMVDVFYRSGAKGNLAIKGRRASGESSISIAQACDIMTLKKPLHLPLFYGRDELQR